MPQRQGRLHDVVEITTASKFRPLREWQERQRERRRRAAAGAGAEAGAETGPGDGSRAGAYPAPVVSFSLTVRTLLDWLARDPHLLDDLPPFVAFPHVDENWGFLSTHFLNRTVRARTCFAFLSCGCMRVRACVRACVVAWLRACLRACVCGQVGW